MYWMGFGWLGGRVMYVSQTSQIDATMNNQSNCHVQWYLLLSAKHCFGNMAEKPLSLGIVSHWIMMTGIECMNLYIFFGGNVFLNEDLYHGNTDKSLKPVKVLPWGGSSQGWLVLAKWCFQQSLYGDTDKSKVSAYSHWVVPHCFMLDYDTEKWNYDLIFFWRKGVFKYGFKLILWNYKQKSQNQWKCCLEAERTSLSSFCQS